MKKSIFTIFFIIIVQVSFSNEEANFVNWLDNFKSKALKEGISQETLNKTFANVRYLEKVIQYDRKQPEFFEDTKTYIFKISKLRTRSQLRFCNQNF